MISPNKNKQELWERTKEIINEIPFFIRFILIAKVLLFILNIFSIRISFYLSNIPSYTISHFQLWRLLTTSFITTNLVNMIIGFILWVKDAISLEKTLGTIRYIIIFVTNSIFINLIFCSIVYLTNKFTKNSNLLGNTSYGVYKVNNSGIWPIIICEMTLLCLNNPDSHIKFLSKPCPIKAKYYPVFIIIIYVLINNFRINFGIISGFIYGVIYFYLFQNRCHISDDVIKKIENSFCCKCLLGFGGFVNIDNIIIYPISNSDVQNVNNLESGQGEFSPFQGKGITVGSTNDYVAVHEQNKNNTLDVINNSENKN